MRKHLRVLLLLTLLCTLWPCAFAGAHRQEELSLKQLFRQTEMKFGVSIAYKSELVSDQRTKVDIAACKSAEEALEKTLAPFNLSFEKVRDKFYLIVAKEAGASVATTAVRPVHGKVTDAKGALLPGVTVRVKGANTGVVTAADGSFTINVPGTATDMLTVTFVGYESKDVAVGTQSELTIVLSENTSTLNEVIVTGYTAQRKKDLTGAVTVVDISEMTKQPSGQVTSQLQGQAAGVTVIGSGQPGQEPVVRIRGVNTFDNNTPLYVVDGVPTQSIVDLNPNDVASMQVLKDAGAASIYGSRASNGVIIITTKRGNGKVKVQYDAYYGRQYPKGGNVFNTLNSQEMANLRWLSYKNSGIPLSDTMYGSGATPVLPDYIQPVGLSANDPRVNPDLYYVNPDYTDQDDYNSFYYITKANKQGTDWFHEIFKPANMTSHNLSVSGGSDRGSYLFSLNYFNQDGTLINTYLKRYTIRSNSVFNVSNHIRIGENLSFSVTDNPQVDLLTSAGVVGMALREQPIIPVYDIKGNFAGSNGIGLGDAMNPVAMQIRTRNNRGLTNRVFGNIFAEVDLFNHFTLHTSFGGEVNDGWNHSFTYPQYENKENSSVNSYTESSSFARNWTWTNTLNYHNVFNSLHTLNVLVGTEAYDERNRSQVGTTMGFFSFDPDYVDNGTGSGGQTITASRYSAGLLSLIGRVDYSYNDKYLLSGTLRRDGSSKFGVNNRYGMFPAFSAGWRISQENFMKHISWLTDLKLRGGWGIMGNQLSLTPGNAYTLYGGNKNTSYYDLYGTNNSTVLGFEQVQIGNPNAKWESDINSNVGIDATLLNGKLEVSADYFQKNIKDLLYNSELPGTYGTAPVPYSNVANMKNKGLDLTISGHTNITHDLKFDATVTFTTFKNRIVRIAQGVDYFDSQPRNFSDNIIRNAVGQPISSFFGYKILGFWNSQSDVDKANQGAQTATGDPEATYQEDAAPGRFRYADLNHDGVINADDRTFLGNPNPKISYGVNLGFTYKQFDFSMFLFGVQGNQIWNQVKWWTDFVSSFDGAKSKTALYDSWLPDRMNAKAPIAEGEGSFSSNGVPNSYYVENGSYLRCKNMQLGYTFPGLGSHIQRFRIYVQAANVFTITKYSGLDPEIGGSDVRSFGIDEGTYPSQRQFLAGVNLTF
jgi:TonB-dependent starch-binding outer membrane protein SusC